MICKNIVVFIELICQVFFRYFLFKALLPRSREEGSRGQGAESAEGCRGEVRCGNVSKQHVKGEPWQCNDGGNAMMVAMQWWYRYHGIDVPVQWFKLFGRDAYDGHDGSLMLGPFWVYFKQEWELEPSGFSSIQRGTRSGTFWVHLYLRRNRTWNLLGSPLKKRQNGKFNFLFSGLTLLSSRSFSRS